MSSISPETVWQIDEESLLTLLEAGKFASKSRLIRFYAPSFMYYRTSYYCSSPKDFPTISITGKYCGLKCRHCGGKVLETMYPAATPDKLKKLCVKLKMDGAIGCLISGGCHPNGSVPLEKFLDAIGWIKRELHLVVFVHTGLIDFYTANRLKLAGVDAALIDVIGSDETISEVYNLKVKPDEFEKSLRALHQAGIAFVPHVIAGLHYGNLKGEFQALKLISKFRPSALVIIAFMPIRGTEMAGVAPPKPVDVARVLASARLMFPEVPLVLGCMRPKGNHRMATDILAVKAGVDAIAFPSEEAVKFAEKEGYDISFSSLCCAQAYADVLKRL